MIKKIISLLLAALLLLSMTACGDEQGSGNSENTGNIGVDSKDVEYQAINHKIL